ARGVRGRSDRRRAPRRGTAPPAPGAAARHDDGDEHRRPDRARAIRRARDASILPARSALGHAPSRRGDQPGVPDLHGDRALAECPELVLVIAPRHPERTREVRALVDRRGWPSVRRSELPAAATAASAQVAPIVVLDTVGELAMLYAVADVVFVGGSLVPVG